MARKSFRHALAEAWRPPKNEPTPDWNSIILIVPKMYRKKLIEEGSRLLLKTLNDLSSRVEKFIETNAKS